MMLTEGSNILPKARSSAYKSCHPLKCKTRVSNLARSLSDRSRTWEHLLDSSLPQGNQLYSRFKHGSGLRKTWKKKNHWSDVLPRVPAEIEKLRLTQVHMLFPDNYDEIEK